MPSGYNGHEIIRKEEEAMRTLLVSLNSQYVHSSLAVWYLLESARSAASDNSIKVLEGTVNQPAEEIAGQIIRFQPDILAFSCYIWNISAVRSLVPRIRLALPHVHIVLGGPEVSFNPEEVLSENPGADYIVTGEGEIPFPLLLTALGQKGDIAGIPGLCYRSGGGIRCNPPALPPAEPPDPYSQEYTGSLGRRIAYLETSRGCPFSCAFCLSGASGSRVRFFSQERARANIVLLANSGTRTVKLVDRTFNCDPSRAFKLFGFIIREAGKAIPSGVCFHFEVAADLVDEKTLYLLKTAPPGLIQLETGIQTFNPKSLADVARKTDTAKTEKNIKEILSSGNIHLHADLIAGLPFEGLASFSDSFDRAYALAPHMLQLGFLKMLNGSNLRARAARLKYRYANTPPYEVIASPWLSGEELHLLHQAEYALGRLYNSGRFTLAIQYILKVSSIRPFDFFSGAGKAFSLVPLSGRRSLDAFTRHAWLYFQTLPGVGPAALRDALVCDRIAGGHKIPDFLKVPDPGLKAVLSQIRKDCFGGKKDVRINAALLYTGGRRAVFAQGTKDPVTGRLPLHFFK